MASSDGLPVIVARGVLVVDPVGDAANDDSLRRVVHADAEKESVSLHLHRERAP